MNNSNRLKLKKEALRKEIISTVTIIYETLSTRHKKDTIKFSPYLDVYDTKIYSFNGIVAETSDPEEGIFLNDLTDDELIDILEAFEKESFEK